MKLFDALFDLILPRRCVVCKKLPSYRTSSMICEPCTAALPHRVQQSCFRCLAPSPRGRTCDYCASSMSLGGIFALYDYKNRAVKNIVKECKYRFIDSLARDMAQLLIAHDALSLALADERSVLVPVPLHPARKRWRGFNQAEIMAKDLGRHYGLRVAAGALTRKKNTVPQADILDRRSRLNNMSGTIAARASARFRGSDIVLVDDVATTGGTLEECAGALKRAGAGRVMALVFAR